MQAVKQLLNNANVTFKSHMLRGEAGSMIVKFAKEHHADCIVIGSRGLNPVQTFLLGSVSSYVAKRAQCSVFIVK